MAAGHPGRGAWAPGAAIVCGGQKLVAHRPGRNGAKMGPRVGRLSCNRGIVEGRLGRHLREGGGRTLPVWVKAANRPDVGKDTGRGPATGVLRWGVEGQPRRAENGQSTKTPGVNVPRGDVRVGLDLRGGLTQPLDEHPLPHSRAGCEQAGNYRGLKRDGSAHVCPESVSPWSHGRELTPRLGYIFAPGLPGPALSRHATKVASRSAECRRKSGAAGTKAAW
jgi:hypothetical protein